LTRRAVVPAPWCPLAVEGVFLSQSASRPWSV